LRELTIDNCSIEVGGTVFIALKTIFPTFPAPNIGFVSFLNIEFFKKIFTFG
jgi:hypothetical protein